MLIWNPPILCERKEEGEEERGCVWGFDLMQISCKIKCGSWKFCKTHLHLTLAAALREFAINCKGVNADTPKFLLEVRMPAPNTSITEVGIIMKTLETYIVGCKFHGEVDIAQGDSISLSRDPKNVKDPNAIKVLLADSGSGQMLGFLPRELAKYLAPLINKYYLQFKVASKLD